MTIESEIATLEHDEARDRAFMAQRAKIQGEVLEYGDPDESEVELITGPREARWVDCEDIPSWDELEDKLDGWSHQDCVNARREKSKEVAKAIKRQAGQATTVAQLDSLWQYGRLFDEESKQLGLFREIGSVLRHCRGALIQSGRRLQKR